MAFRFWRRVKIAPGISLNLSKSGGSLSLGPRGAKFTIGPRGPRATAGIPGTGLFYTTTFPNKRRRRKRKSYGQANHPAASSSSTVPERDCLTLGFFQRLITPADEEALVDGCRELFSGNDDCALEYFRRSAHLADGAFMGGYLALKKNLPDEAGRFLESARQNQRRLGRLFQKYRIAAACSIAITPEVTAHVRPNLRGVLLGLVEAYQQQQHYPKALECLQQLLRLEPNDIVVKLSLAELLLDARPADQKFCRKIVQLAEGIENETALHTALLLYEGKALRSLGMPEAAKTVLSGALRRKADRPAELLHALHYERALAYEALEQKSRARGEFEKLFAEAPDYEDVAARLGL
jgi:tetratricopeptide (TPR) repeat protein